MRVWEKNKKILFTNRAGKCTQLSGAKFSIKQKEVSEYCLSFWIFFFCFEEFKGGIWFKNDRFLWRKPAAVDTMYALHHRKLAHFVFLSTLEIRDNMNQNSIKADGGECQM